MNQEMIDMATRTIAHMFDRYEDATAAVTALEAAGFSHNDVSLVANQGATGTATGSTIGDATTAGVPGDRADHAAAGTGTGASIGTIIGGGAGLLAGIGALAIPGVGPIVAAGWLIATLTGAGVGAAAGGLLGSLTGAGIPEEHAQVYTEGVRRGGSLVTVRAEESRVAEAESILNGHGPVDVNARGADYRATSDWAGFDANRGTLTAEEMAAERTRIGGRTAL